MNDLLKEYKETRKKLRIYYDQLRDELTPVGYRVPSKNGKIKTIYEGLDAERQGLGSMISDVEYVIEWLETGRRPGNRRGIERRAAYQREKLMDPVRMQAFASNSTAGSPCNLTEWQKFRLEEVLSNLSPRERECYELHYGMCFSFGKIAEMLNIKKGTVQSYIECAEKKIKDAKIGNLFLVAG